MTTYLLLNEDDITEVCGTISRKEATEELGMTNGQFHMFISSGKPFRGKYILVEDEKPKVNKNNEVKNRIVCETPYGRRYYVTSDGKFFVAYKNGGIRYLNGYIKKNHGRKEHHVKLGDKDYTSKNLIASLFLEEYKSGDVVILRDNNPGNVDMNNLIVIDRAVYARMTGPMSRSKQVGLYEDGKLVRTFRSAREAGRKLYCSYQMVNDYCNNRSKRKEMDLRWM